MATSYTNRTKNSVSYSKRVKNTVDTASITIGQIIGGLIMPLMYSENISGDSGYTNRTRNSASYTNRTKN